MTKIELKKKEEIMLRFIRFIRFKRRDAGITNANTLVIK